jgi:hypothetical protein
MANKNSVDLAVIAPAPRGKMLWRGAKTSTRGRMRSPAQPAAKFDKLFRVPFV